MSVCVAPHPPFDRLNNIPSFFSWDLLMDIVVVFRLGRVCRPFIVVPLSCRTMEMLQAGFLNNCEAESVTQDCYHYCKPRNSGTSPKTLYNQKPQWPSVFALGEPIGNVLPDSEFQTVRVVSSLEGLPTLFSLVPWGTDVTKQIVIGTPGTVLDWCFKRKLIDLTKIRVFVLDEADVMIDTQGFADHSIRIQR